jgi:hypothetical protein
LLRQPGFRGTRYEGNNREPGVAERLADRQGETMPATDEDDELSGSRQVVLILRLVLDRQAGLRHGELLDTDAVGEGRFVSLDGLAEAVSRWLDRQRERVPEIDWPS